MRANNFFCTLLRLISFFGVAGGFIADLSMLAFTGTPRGQVISFNGLDLYIAMPANQSGKAPGTIITNQYGVLLLTDVFGIQSTENKLLVDSFARAGYVTVAPDLFDGKPRPEDPKADFNATEFFGAHGPEVTDPKVAKAVSYLREQMGVQKIASTGYCFGGRYAFRVLGIPDNKGVQVGFAAHPSQLGDEEIKAINGPASLAAAEADTGMKAARRAEIEAALGTTGQPFTMTLYGGTPHGFATHPNLNNPVQKAAKGDAFVQAVRFYETWL
ncbi:dienelactone hydrolase [Colletotrichum graminicola M1.001]|uniref:Dienelactone hydrolase n=1 Tax=Colletotrichum graminicola (strain M1.001 / M2 / FGSC 10212) TaxID=645133 RepID=E3QWX9_COLGM|nr:dienelactone hydrolase [Colletotrichum graminicola M1.001]EFQ35367.1 dienelactone hydrolase [Colletotrichum graminicola M1.001]